MKNKHVKKRSIKNVVDKWTKLFKPGEKISNKITVLGLHSVHDNVWELWLCIREFPLYAMLNPSLKSSFNVKK